MAAPVPIGGEPLVRLTSDAFDGPGFVEATVLPGRGMMLLQARLRLPSGELCDGLAAPAPTEAAAALNGGPDDFAGNQSFSFGGAILAPFANRITGRAVAGAREIETTVDGRAVRLPRNWGGKRPGAAQYAMHGLILQSPVAWRQDEPRAVSGRLAAGDFGGHWPSATELGFEWRLAAGVLSLRVEARNVGHDRLPMALGWHPYFALPSGDRRQARLRVPARARTEVDNYDDVLPTGRLAPTAGSAFDFTAPGGRALAEQYLDDCFTDLVRQDGEAVVDILDPAAGLALSVASPTPQVKAFQVFAPPDHPFVVVEPQFNLADPYGDVWPAGFDTGMAHLEPGQALSYDVRVSASALGT